MTLVGLHSASPFSRRLREATSAAHDRAESQQFIQLLLKGSLNVRALVLLLESLLPVYEQLEVHMRDQAAEPTVGLFDHRSLDRAQRLRDDLARFGRCGIPGPNPAVDAYVNVIADSAASPQRLLAHHYTRYLGDLAGGQVISRLVQRHYGVPESHLSYYDFSDLGDTHHYRKTYRALLDLVQWTLDEQAEFIEECERAYTANAVLFAALAQRLGLVSGTNHTMDSLSKAETRHGIVLNATHGRIRRERQDKRDDRGARTPA